MKAHQRVPPKVPVLAAELQRAIMLLGERTKHELKAMKRQEIIDLLGRYPDAQTAATWKSALKKVRQDEIFE